MKRILLILFLSVLFTYTATAGIVVNGKYKGEHPESVQLLTTQRGEIFEVGSYKVADNGSFKLEANLEKAGFILLRSGRASFCFYMNPDEILNIEIESDKYTLVGKKSAENLELQRWYDIILPIDVASIFSPVDKMSLEQYNAINNKVFSAYQNYTAKSTGNKQFDRDMSVMRYADFILNTVDFMRFSGHMHNASYKEYPVGVQSVDFAKLTSSDALLNIPNGKKALEAAESIDMASNVQKEREISEKVDYAKYYALDYRLSRVIDRSIKGEIIVKHASMLRSSAGLKNLEQKYSDILVNQGQKDALSKSIADKISEESDGAFAYNFRGVDVNGKEYSLSDFKGKYVYVDIWAQWCGPCKAQIPYLKTIEQEYHGKNIEFVSVSTDNVQDEGKWKKYVTDNDMTGIQIISLDAHELRSKFEIKGIPRFLLIDPDGRIINVDAPRPSSEETRLMLDALLK